MSSPIINLFVGFIIQVAAHGAVTQPPPRNRVDSDDLAAQANATYTFNNQSCPLPDGKDTTSPVNGQACYWCDAMSSQQPVAPLTCERVRTGRFTNGASIGCPPDAITRGPIPSVPCDSNVTHTDGMCAKKMDTCGRGFEATICDPKLRTVNTQAPCGSPEGASPHPRPLAT